MVVKVFRQRVIYFKVVIRRKIEKARTDGALAI